MKRRRGGSDYEVGYAKPPLHTRFKPGQSGNPAGRPKGAGNLETALAAELRQLIVVKEGGVAKRMTKLDALVKRWVEAALRGDVRAMNALVALTRAEPEPETAAPPSKLSRSDQAIIERYLGHRERKKRRSGE
jgi:hypothetical protein